MPDQSGCSNDGKFASTPSPEFCKLPSDAATSQHVPSFSRHVNMGLVAGYQKDGYVTLTNGVEADAFEPTLKEAKEPYVSAGHIPSQDSMTPAKRPSVLKLQKDSIEEEKPLPEAYCHVGSSQSPLTPGMYKYM